MTNKYIKTPFPGESRGEGVWKHCTTWYEINVLFPKHKELGKKGLPTYEGENPPNE